MTLRSFVLPFSAATLALLAFPGCASHTEARPIRALLITGGCCHDYATQSKLLKEGIQARANVQVDIVLAKDNTTTTRFPMYEHGGWAKGYDVVIHQECGADVKDIPYIQNIINEHKTVPAVNLHCAMHCYRSGTDIWFKYLGIQSSGHGPQQPISVNYVDKESPITQGLANWTTTKDELYNNVNLFNPHPLALGKQIQPNGTTQEFVIAWTNETQGARTFSTTMGHNTENVAEPNYLDLVTRGVLWASGKLNADYQKPYQGPAGTLTVIEKPAK